MTIKAMSVTASPMRPSLISVPGLFPPAKSAPAEDHAVLRQSSLRGSVCTVRTRPWARFLVPIGAHELDGAQLYSRR